MSNLYVQEIWINRSEGHGIGKSDVYETYTDDRGKLYRDYVREYGRCIGKMYTDEPAGKARPIGWVFLQRAKYEDTGEPYLRETWVSLHTEPPTKTIEYHYIGGEDE